MQQICRVDWLSQADADLLRINAGAVAEQFVGQELLAGSPSAEQGGLFFWKRDRRGNQIYAIVSGFEIVR